MDAVVCYDAYWPMIEQLTHSGLNKVARLEGEPLSIAEHDHKLLMILMEMQGIGFKIDESARAEVEEELRNKLDEADARLTVLVEPIVKKKIGKFKKPHLFQVDRKCSCCGGGTKQRLHCYRCSPWESELPITREVIKEYGFKSIKEFEASLPRCNMCNGTGKILKQLPFNSDSSDQVADVLYRGLSIRPRKFKGEETVKAAQLEPLKDVHPIVNEIIQVSNIRSDYDTVKRLNAGPDGLLHCEFDPWGTGSGRVAGKEGLLEAGTNPMNLPKEARRFVVPRPGYTFLYPDMAQIEARAMAVLSGDKNLRKALYEPLPERDNSPDYHTWLLNALSDYDSRIRISRDQSKRVSYAGFYGARAEQLAKELTAEAIRKGKGMHVDVGMAKTILEVLYRVCPGLKTWQDKVAMEVLETRKLKNPCTGREFTFLGYIVDKKNKGELDYEIKKQVWSRLPQDIGAYVLGLGLIDLKQHPSYGHLFQPLVHVHDALLIEAPIDRIDEAEAIVLQTLSRYIWEMDFPAESKRGDNWYAAS